MLAQHRSNIRSMQCMPLTGLLLLAHTLRRTPGRVLTMNALNVVIVPRGSLATTTTAKNEDCFDRPRALSRCSYYHPTVQLGGLCNDYYYHDSKESLDHYLQFFFNPN